MAKDIPQKPCEQCHQPFAPKRAWQKYCGPTCSSRARNARNPIMRCKEIERRIHEALESLKGG